MAFERFPLLGFPGEINRPDGNVLYQCHFPNARIALWVVAPFSLTKRYELNLYKPLPHDAHRDDTLTDPSDRFAADQPPITIRSALEAQLAIFYLVQTYLPTETIDDIYSTDQAASG